MRMALSASAHNPQNTHLPRSSAAAPGPSPHSIAPVGQTAAAGRASVQLAQSISGLPRARLETAADDRG